ncbi:MAG: YhcH/YjgK/YiaL family protein [Chitinispirillaceae bacterium]
MILDQLGNMHKYVKIHPALMAVLEFLETTDLDGFTSGRRNISGDRIYALATTGQGKGLADTKLEAHRRYIDIQYAVSGIDNIGWKPMASCRRACGEYDSISDVIFYSDAPDTWFGLVPGTFAVFFPEDAHAPLAVNGLLHKVVIKLLLDW